MKLRGIPVICLGPTGNIQGTYSFLYLARGPVIKCRRFTEIPAPDSVIKCVATLAHKSGVSPNLVFVDRHKIPFDWPNNSEPSIGLDPTPMAIYPHIPAKMPGVLLSSHAPTANDPPLPAPSHKIDWSHLANKAAWNADLDVTEHLPPPPGVIKIDDNNDFIYVPPVTLFIKQEPVNSTSIDIPATSPSMLVTSQSIPSPACAPYMSRIPPPSRTSTHTWHLPGHLDDYHMFITVAYERRQPPGLPYHTAGSTNVNLAIQDKEQTAHHCHLVMVHTATSLELTKQGHPTKKQYSLKAGLKRFGSRGDTAVAKELSQLHTMNCFRPCDPNSLTRDDRRNALSSLMFLTE